MLSLFINEYPDATNFIHKKLHNTLVDEFHQNAFSSIRNEKSKLRTYALVKTDIGMEKYLAEIKNVKSRIKFTKFRLSNHNLMIETGRYKGLKPEQRLCPFCPNFIEDELHFLLDCRSYKPIRSMFMEMILKQHNFLFHLFSTEQKFRYLLTNLCHVTADFIYKICELRDFLLQHPKRRE